MFKTSHSSPTVLFPTVMHACTHHVPVSNPLWFHPVGFMAKWAPVCVASALAKATHKYGMVWYVAIPPRRPRKCCTPSICLSICPIPTCNSEMKSTRHFTFTGQFAYVNYNYGNIDCRLKGTIHKRGKHIFQHWCVPIITA